MCDTILAPPVSTAAQRMLFGKNSDRQRNEAQAVDYFPRRQHAGGDRLACTYITIPQVARTHAVLLCRPFWIWGAEMGANEHGVVIGNEGLYARSPAGKEPALIGMDLVRLGLERATRAAEAVEIMTRLLEEHGQGGNCGHLTPSYYHNGFLVADFADAFVLETVEREWLVERVSGVRAISNRYSIARDVLRKSTELARLVHERGWSRESAPDYAQAIGDASREHSGNAGARYAQSSSLLRSIDGRASVREMMAILRDHGVGGSPHPQWRAECAVQRTLCMHAGEMDRGGQTVGSMVSELSATDTVHWVTGTAAPCISIFKPVLMDAPPQPSGPPLTDRFDPRTLWWRHERLHRSALRQDFTKFIKDIRAERDDLEADFQLRIRTVLNGGNRADRSRVVGECWQRAAELEERWYQRWCLAPSARGVSCSPAWDSMSQLAGMES